MPELSRFAGIIIKMLYNDSVQHHKPHVHVYYGEYEASIGIDGGTAGWFFARQAVKNGDRMAGAA